MTVPDESLSTNPCEARAIKKRQQRNEAIPEEWRLRQNILGSLKTPLERSKNNLMEPNLVRQSGILTVKELQITESSDVTSLLKALASGQLTAEEVTVSFCKRAAVAQQLTNCLTEIFFDRALERAQYLDRQKGKGQLVGPLHGLPISLKDSFQIAGVASTLGLTAYLDHRAESNSALVDILLALGAVLYCKTNVPQTMMTPDSHNFVFGRTLNPWNTSLSAGGSSGGEGALIAMRGAPIGVGTDIAGQFGRKLRFGLLPEDPTYPLHPPVRRTVAEASRLLQASGHEVVELPSDECRISEALQVAFALFSLDETADGIVKAAGEPPIPSRIRIGQEMGKAPQEFVSDLRNLSELKQLSGLNLKRQELISDWCRLWQKYEIDAVIGPGGRTTAIEHDEFTLPPYTVLMNVLDCPACIIPFGRVTASDAAERLDMQPGQVVPSFGVGRQHGVFLRNTFHLVSKPQRPNTNIPRLAPLPSFAVFQKHIPDRPVLQCWVNQTSLDPAIAATSSRSAASDLYRQRHARAVVAAASISTVEAIGLTNELVARHGRITEQRTSNAITSTVDSATRSGLRSLCSAGSSISQEELWHVNNLLTSDCYLEEFVIGPSFCHRHRDTLVSQYDTSRSTVEDAYIALAMIWGLRDPSTSPDYPSLNTCYKRASSAILTLRSLDVRIEHHVQPCLVLGVSLVTFALKLGGTHVLPLCSHILSLVKPYYEAGKRLVDPDLLIVISLNEMAECLFCARTPTLLVELPPDQAESYVNRYIGLSANILPYLFHICKISAEMAHGDPVDKEKTLSHLEEEIRRWQPSIQDSRMSEFTPTEVSHMVCQASTMQTAALLIIHRLRYPYGTEDLAASAMASSILSQNQMTQKITGRAPRHPMRHGDEILDKGAKSPYPMGSYFYVCGGDKFERCCSTDPCLLPDCPRGPLKRDDNENLPVESSTSSNKGSSNSGSPKTETPEPDEPKETTKASPSPSETKTDSGITHTIPNSSIVTITKHTVVFSEAPPSSTTSIPETSTGTAPGTTCSDCNEPGQTSNSDEDASHEVGVTPGTIAGIAAGGAIILALVVIIWVVARRRKRERQSSGVSDEDTTGGSRVDGYEKVTPHTTGTGGVGDPFAPFGGRTDQPHGPDPPHSETFEMDGTGIAPVELPATSIWEAPGPTASPLDVETPVTPANTDPRATLASGSSQGCVQYVNQWNQYRSMAEADERGV
ncbi:hypothetical protein MHUMG1_06324 [Metarhizium humberi]|uniref:Amidase domain-containing protein n=1 Tax=Metarhizium humberi TaxID=2596975 RepID=A0A9P8M8Z5_9HYPO|nr:hypothetical protein MHUMG1_06324 [Metarhizium humberi]